MTRQQQALAIGIAVTAVALVASCGSSQQGGSAAASGSSTLPASSATSATSSASSSGDTGVADGKATITISDFAYSGPASVSPGATVTVVNQDSQKHTVTSKGSKDFDVPIDGGGGTATFTAPSSPGTYAYICTFHGNMIGTLVVR